ncbi:GNAT family N-acetyltransferase [Psychrobacillus sp. NEAU-3TGS]|uniref:GNAT family N-acetyltransferase n=1 Tax=Psychrobacillus sp. NEAU-3TGS TaxID=2995412 RepID=UPI0024961EE5|nr:GNAT family N-acetyltransferase [Psychrobacillus sp. NEAU-3TGS]MDI2588682.1 GNAT family N-acetyltransferase [Psychrobacillus sp. NEAU-3TGS]
MISELKKFEFFKCKDLLYEQGQLEAKAVIEGVNPGRVFVDDINHPISGLIWLGNNDGFIFIGDEKNEGFNNELNNFIDNIIIPEAIKVGLTWFEGIGNHRKWNTTIEKVLKSRKLGSWNQRVYTLQKDDYKCNSELAIDQGYKVVKICETLFENNDFSIKNIEFLHSQILEFWSSFETFFCVGIGYCMIYKDEIVSICFSGFVVGNIHAVSIETIEGHRGKKLAQKIAKSFVTDCLNNNIVPYWDCMESNKPSIAVAENIGFKNVFNYIGYDFSFK